MKHSPQSTYNLSPPDPEAETTDNQDSLRTQSMVALPHYVAESVDAGVKHSMKQAKEVRKGRFQSLSTLRKTPVFEVFKAPENSPEEAASSSRPPFSAASHLRAIAHTQTKVCAEVSASSEGGVPGRWKLKCSGLALQSASLPRLLRSLVWDLGASGLELKGNLFDGSENADINVWNLNASGDQDQLQSANNTTSYSRSPLSRFLFLEETRSFLGYYRRFITPQHLFQMCKDLHGFPMLPPSEYKVSTVLRENSKRRQRGVWRFVYLWIRFNYGIDFTVGDKLWYSIYEFVNAGGDSALLDDLIQNVTAAPPSSEDPRAPLTGATARVSKPSLLSKKSRKQKSLTKKARNLWDPVMSVSESAIAAQLLLYSSSVFAKLSRHDLVSRSYLLAAQPAKASLSPAGNSIHVLNAISLHNVLRTWVHQAVMLCPLEDRAKLIQRFYCVIDASLQYRDYFSAHALLTGTNSPMLKMLNQTPPKSITDVLSKRTHRSTLMRSLSSTHIHVLPALPWVLAELVYLEITVPDFEDGLPRGDSVDLIAPSDDDKSAPLRRVNARKLRRAAFAWRTLEECARRSKSITNQKRVFSDSDRGGFLYKFVSTLHERAEKQNLYQLMNRMGNHESVVI